MESEWHSDSVNLLSGGCSGKDIVDQPLQTSFRFMWSFTVERCEYFHHQREPEKLYAIIWHSLHRPYLLCYSGYIFCHYERFKGLSCSLGCNSVKLSPHL